MLPVHNVGVVYGSRGDNVAAVFSIADSKRYGTYQSCIALDVDACHRTRNSQKCPSTIIIWNKHT